MLYDAKLSGAPELVGTAPVHTIGLVIANMDPVLREKLELPAEYPAFGILSTRIGATTQLIPIDDAVKSTNTEFVRFEIARDTEGYGGPGVTLIVGSKDVSDARRAIELALKGVRERIDNIYINEVGHMEIQTSARAGSVLNKVFGAPLGKAFGFMAIGPAGIGIVTADAAMKAAPVDVIWHGRPAYNTPFHNDTIFVISGDCGAVEQATQAAYEMGSKLISTLGSVPKPILTFMQGGV